MKRRLHVHAKHGGMGKGGQFQTTESHAKARKNSRLRPANGTDGGGCLILVVVFFVLLIACSRRTVIVENPGIGEPDTLHAKHIIRN